MFVKIIFYIISKYSIISYCVFIMILVNIYVYDNVLLII